MFSVSEHLVTLLFYRTSFIISASDSHTFSFWEKLSLSQMDHLLSLLIGVLIFTPVLFIYAELRAHPVQQ